MTKLTTVTIGTSVISIGEHAFRGCSELKTLNFNAVSCDDFAHYMATDYDRNPFYGLNISIINIGNSVQRIPSFFAYGQTKLTNITIPNSVTEIGYFAFYNCSGLTRANIPNNIKYISIGLFYGCSNLTSITIPNSVTSIGYDAFRESGLTSVTIPNSVETICGLGPWQEAHGAFENCCNLKDVSIGENVKTIENYVFRGCENVEKLIWLPKNCSTMGDMPKSNITQVTIGPEVELIPYYFVENSKITAIEIPGSVKTIDEQAFYGCDHLTIATIGNSVNTIKRGVFRDCKNLAKVYCKAAMPPMYESYDNLALFDDVTFQNAILYVPDLTYSYYKQNDPWKKFMDIKTEPYSDDGVVFSSTVYPTSIRMDGVPEGVSSTANSHFTFGNKDYKTLLVTGLEPLSIYSATYTPDGKSEIPLKFYTSALMMVAEGAKMLNETTAQLQAETNMADEETICGFDWRRYEGPDDYLGTRVYCPVYDGKMAGTLKNLAKDTYYKYRPFYKSSAGNVYYGDWVTFYTADAGVEFDPVVYTYNSPAVTQTGATLEGVALRGSDEITSQGFEYWKSGSSSVTKVNATGERMSASISGLQSGAKYVFRAFVTAGGKTMRGANVEFVTLSQSMDVNSDGEITIADVNVVIDIILGKSSGSVGDVNGDGEVTIADINAIINSIIGM